MRISGVGCGIVDQEFGAFQKINSVGEDWTTNAQLGAGITDVFEMSTADAGAWKRIFEVELPLIAGAACFSDDHAPKTGVFVVDSGYFKDRGGRRARLSSHQRTSRFGRL